MRHLKKAIWPHLIAFDRDNSHEEVARAESWLEKTYGPVNKRWTVVRGFAFTHFYFKEGRDATLFSLSCL